MTNCGLGGISGPQDQFIWLITAQLRAGNPVAPGPGRDKVMQGESLPSACRCVYHVMLWCSQRAKAGSWAQPRGTEAITAGWVHGRLTVQSPTKGRNDPPCITSSGDRTQCHTPLCHTPGPPKDFSGFCGPHVAQICSKMLGLWHTSTECQEM